MTRPPKPPATEVELPATEIELEVWQFVRLMVELEDGPGEGRLPKSVPESWGLAWREIDARLSERGKNDPDDYASLMMDQVVALTVSSSKHMEAAIKAIGRVIPKLERQSKGSSDKKERRDLAWEAESLSRLAAELRRRQADAAD